MIHSSQSTFSCVSTAFLLIVGLPCIISCVFGAYCILTLASLFVYNTQSRVHHTLDWCTFGISLCTLFEIRVSSQFVFISDSIASIRFAIDGFGDANTLRCAEL